MIGGKNYLYNIQGKVVPYYTQKILGASYTLRMYPISKSRINIFSELYFYTTGEQN